MWKNHHDIDGVLLYVLASKVRGHHRDQKKTVIDFSLWCLWYTQSSWKRPARQQINENLLEISFKFGILNPFLWKFIDFITFCTKRDPYFPSEKMKSCPLEEDICTLCIVLCTEKNTSPITKTFTKMDGGHNLAEDCIFKEKHWLIRKTWCDTVLSTMFSRDQREMTMTSTLFSNYSRHFILKRRECFRYVFYQDSSAWEQGNHHRVALLLSYCLWLLITRGDIFLTTSVLCVSALSSFFDQRHALIGLGVSHWLPHGIYCHFYCVVKAKSADHLKEKV